MTYAFVIDNLKRNEQKTIIIQITKHDNQKLPILSLENEPLSILKHMQGDISNQ